MKTCTVKQWESIRGLINLSKAHFKEIKISELPNEAINIGYEQAAYGDWNYYVLPDGSFVCTYYNIGD